MTALQCAMAVLIVIEGGLFTGTFKEGFTNMCWPHLPSYHTNLEMQARYTLHTE